MLRIPHCLDNRLTVNCEILATCSRAPIQYATACPICCTVYDGTSVLSESGRLTIGSSFLITCCAQRSPLFHSEQKSASGGEHSSTGAEPTCRPPAPWSRSLNACDGLWNEYPEQLLLPRWTLSRLTVRPGLAQTVLVF
jgi:hypothetical protein